MAIGKLQFQLFFGQEAYPVKNAKILIIDSISGIPVFEGLLSVDDSGKSEIIDLYTLDKELSVKPNPNVIPYTTYDAYIVSDTFRNVLIKNIEIFADVTSIQPVSMLPKGKSINEFDIVAIPPHGLVKENEFPDSEENSNISSKVSDTNNKSTSFLLKKPVIPANITVHLGTPSSNASNVTVPFTSYIKNVASSEIYPTWPENAIRSNIYAQISFTLNRIYTEWYRSRGYNFDITNSTAYDHYFVNGRDIFDNISKIVDDIFDDYISRTDFLEPLLAQYCNGTTVTCNGLSQWGTVSLANSGYYPFKILTYYYGNNIELRNAPVVDAVDGSYPGTALKLGSSGNSVKTIQTQLNRIAKNYPAIPISPTDGYFNDTTEKAVKTFQKIFNLTQDGIVGKGTWYKISQIYVGVKNLAELDSEGEKLPIEPTPPSYILKIGSKGDGVKILQYFLNSIGLFYDTIPPLKIDGIFGNGTKNAVEAFQKTFGLDIDGIVGKATWRKLYEIYKTVEPYLIPTTPTPYPGYVIGEGARGENVKTIQTWISTISKTYPSIPSVSVDGIFGPLTTAAVIAFQSQFSLIPDGLVGPLTWEKLDSVYSSINK